MGHIVAPPRSPAEDRAAPGEPRPHRGRLAALLLLLLTLTAGDRAALAAAGAPEATAIRVEVGADRRTRVTVELDRAVSFRTLVTPRPPLRRRR